VAGTNEQPRLRRRRRHTAIGSNSQRLERTHGRRAYGDDAPRLPARARQGVSRLRRHDERLRIDDVILDLLGADRLERAITHVKRDLDPLDAAGLERVEYGFSEMKAGSGRRDRATRTRVHGLIPVPIGVTIAPLDVRRKRDMPHPIDRARYRASIVSRQAERTPAEEMCGENLAVQSGFSPLEEDAGAGLELLAGMDERVPRVVLAGAEEERFHGAAARNAMAEQARRKDSGVVDDQKVSGLEVLGQVGELGVLYRARVALQHQETRSAANGGRLLCNQLIRQLEIEVCHVHLINILGSALAADWSVFDVVIVGGGPAGLSAALVLGRCRRQVLVCDSGRPRNAASRALHGYLTRDGIAPLELLRLAREELRQYGIEPRAAQVTAVSRATEGFTITLDDGETIASRTVLFATGVADRLPEIAGIDECYGVTVHHCPYCDGWEVRDRRLAVVGHGAAAVSLALSLKTWSRDVTICSNGRSKINPRHRKQLGDQRVPVYETTIEQLDHVSGHVQRLVLADGTAVPCDAVFLSTGQQPQSDLPRQLGCELTRRGVVKTDHLGQTCVPGLYVAGDASRDVQFVIVAAAEGAKAAVAINKSLQLLAGHAMDTAFAS
jgi:thioredoxin reductase